MTAFRAARFRSVRRARCWIGPLILVAFGSTAWAGGDGVQEADNLRLVREQEARRVAVFERAARSVVCIFGDRARQGGGSGVIITPDGYGLTNFHVVASMLEKRQGVGGLADGRLYPLHVLGVDPGGDLAMFKLSGKDRFDYAPLGDSDAVRVGDWVAAMGNPFVLAEDFTPTITYGIVSGTHRYQAGQGNALEYADCIQVSSSINPGNSGGPLFNMTGEIIGINGRASFEERGRVNVGLGYAISANQIKRFVPGLRAGQLCAHGTLGATVSSAGSELVFDAIQGMSPIDLAGIRLGDRLLAINDRPLGSANAFLNVLTPLPAGWPTKVTVRRGDRTIDSTVRLERVIVPMEHKYELDFAHNHGEIRRLFKRFALRDGLTPQRAVRMIAWFGRLSWGNAASLESSAMDSASSPHPRSGPHPRAAESALMAVMQTAASISVEHQATCAAATITINEASQTSDGPIWRDPRVWSEWQLITMPILAREKITLGWELLGGDEVDGRVVYVVEHRLSTGRRVRWKFDGETEDIVQATIGDEAAPEMTVWTPTAEQGSGRAPHRPTPASRAWPMSWTRQATDLPPITVEVDGFGPVFGQRTAGGDLKQ